ncbi:MAG: hydantoinase/oxoprolinase family protein, partial [Bacillota bacterium]
MFVPTTNAVVVGLKRPVALALIGYDRELLDQFQLNRHVFATLAAHFPGGHDVYGRPRPGFDPEEIAEWAKRCWPEVEAFAVSAYFSPLNSRCEKEAAEAIRRQVPAPVAAASAVGATFLAGRATALVVDVGGTSSDIALVVDGSPRISQQGAEVGGYPTAVPAVAVRTLGLGGDSRVQLAGPAAS